MSDLFHKKIPMEFIDRVFDTMEVANRHIFQILTKRSSLMKNYIREVLIIDFLGYVSSIAAFIFRRQV